MQAMAGFAICRYRPFIVLKIENRFWLGTSKQLGEIAAH
jgi:hypothetical protein